jgi:hypothetical protein
MGTYCLGPHVQPGTRWLSARIDAADPLGYEYSGSFMMLERVAGPMVAISSKMAINTPLSMDLSRGEAG